MCLPNPVQMEALESGIDQGASRNGPGMPDLRPWHEELPTFLLHRQLVHNTPNSIEQVSSILELKTAEW